MAKLKATVNGVKLKDGDKVTLVIQAKVRITERQGWNGSVTNVEFDYDEGQATIDAWPSEDFPEGEVPEGQYRVDSVTVVKR
jgi:hypothetical protein